MAEVLVETTVLTLAGGLLGLLVGAAGMRLLAMIGAEHLPLGARIVFDARVASIALAGAAMMGVVMGVPVAWHTLREGSRNPLHFDSRTATAGRAAQRLRHGFIVGPDRARLHAARRGGAARSEPEKGDGDAARLPGGAAS